MELPEIKVNHIETKSVMTKALVDIDEKLKSIQQKAGKGNVGYYGVAHITFAFLVGYDFGDQSKIYIFHRKRHNDEV